MSNLYFYVANEDILPLVDFIFQNGFEVYESDSEAGQDLTIYKDTNGVWDAYQKELKRRPERPMLWISLWHPSMGGKVVIRRIGLSPKVCSGETYRYKAEGWGLIRMQLGGVATGKRISVSWVGNNSEKYAAAWQSTRPILGSYLDWDWNIVAKFSRMIQ